MAEPKRQEGFIYIKSDLLNQEVAFSLKSGWVYCQDKTQDGSLVWYSPKELEILAKSGSVITPGIHNVKKIIGGTIVECGAEKNGRGGVPGASGNVQPNRDGELEIF